MIYKHKDGVMEISKGSTSCKNYGKIYRVVGNAITDNVSGIGKEAVSESSIELQIFKLKI